MTTPPCLNAPHPAPPRLAEILPPVVNEDPLAFPGAHDVQMATALAAAWADCEQCTTRHRELAAGNCGQINVALHIVLTWVGLTLNSIDVEPANSAAGLLKQVVPEADRIFTNTTYALLLEVPVNSLPAPNGKPIAMWNPDVSLELLTKLPEQQRARAWNECLAFLHGVVKGEGEALDEHEAEQR